jgi:heptaprenyl diphosphate synthase
VALAAAVCLFLSSIEYLIPKPLPFLRLGLANLPLLVCLDLLPLGPFLLLLLLKILGQGLVQGSLFSVIFLFSAAGTLASGAVMLGARRLLGQRISLIGISVLGALASNLVQLALAGVVAFGPSAWLIAPPFLAVGLVTSAVLGALAQGYVRRSSFLKRLRSSTPGQPLRPKQRWPRGSLRTRRKPPA